MKRLYFLLFCLIIPFMLFNCVNAGSESTALQEPGKTKTQEDGQTQFLRGRQYYWGQGMVQNSQEALKWFRKSAEQGNADAQFALGSMYYLGDGVPRDYVQAHMWFTMAAVQGNVKAQEIRNVVAEKMTPAQMEEARKLAPENSAVQNRPN